jgi:hypothetical protein
MFVVLYFLMIRPQMKRAKEHKALLEALAKGDEVITGGGIAGKITKVGEQLRQSRSGRRRRDAGAEAGRAAGSAQGHDEGALTSRTRCLPAGNGDAQLTASIHESLSALEIRHPRPRTALRPDLHAAELLRRVAGGAGFQRQGDDQDRRPRSRVSSALQAAAIADSGIFLDGNGVKVRLSTPTQQLKAKDVAAEAAQSGRRLNRSTSSRSTCCRASPRWLTSLRRAADVPRPRPARRRALPAAGRHERR